MSSWVVDIRSRLRAGWVAAGITLLVIASGCSSAGRTETPSPVPQGWPVSPNMAAISSGYGVPRGGSYHRGLDLAAPKGSAVIATAPGRVSFAGRSGEFGRLVVIDHGDGWRTRYAHLKEISVKEGKRVDRGQIIGAVGKSGNATGFHLHYEVLHNGSRRNPEPYLSSR